MAFIAINSTFVYIADNHGISIPVYDSNFFLLMVKKYLYLCNLSFPIIMKMIFYLNLLYTCQ